MARKPIGVVVANYAGLPCGPLGPGQALQQQINGSSQSVEVKEVIDGCPGWLSEPKIAENWPAPLWGLVITCKGWDWQKCPSGPSLSPGDYFKRRPTTTMAGMPLIVVEVDPGGSWRDEVANAMRGLLARYGFRYRLGRRLVLVGDFIRRVGFILLGQPPPPQGWGP